MERRQQFGIKGLDGGKNIKDNQISLPLEKLILWFLRMKKLWTSQEFLYKNNKQWKNT